VGSIDSFLGGAPAQREGGPLMSDPLLFAIGVGVTAIVTLAVWSIGQLELEDGADAKEPDSSASAKA
jgi:hypothetical protein